MKYVGLLVGYVDPNRNWETLPEDERNAELESHGAFSADVEKTEGAEILGGEALTGGDSATVLRVVDGETVLTDGPFTESTEAIGGFYVLEAPDLDVAARLFSTLSLNVIEIRPVDTSVG